MCSFAVRNSLLQVLFAVLTLVLAAATEDLSPKFASVGFPVLLSAVQFMAVRRRTLAAVAFAIAAGVMEDALSSLPVMTSASYFLGVAAVSRWLEFPRAVTVLTYPFYQAWLWMWVPEIGGNIFRRMLVALPMGLFAAFAVGALLALAERRSAIDEAG